MITPTLLTVLIVLNYFSTVRYIGSGPSTSPFRSPIYRNQVLSGLSEADFVDAVRVTPRQVKFIVEIIQGHEVFLRRGEKPQTEVTIQLKVALHVLAHDGSHASDKALARILDISVGSLSKYYHRCVIALCSKITTFLSWPDEEEKNKIKEQFLVNHSFSDLIGAIDGTTFLFYRAPSFDKDCWITRSGKFAMGAMAVCDHRSAFIYFGTGYLGSRHDSKAHKGTQLYKQKIRHFSGDDYIVGDAVFGLIPTLITGFKGRHLTKDEKTFNKRLSAVRIFIEHRLDC